MLNQGLYEITNNEGMICRVDTTNSANKTFGQNWVDICESTLNGQILKGVIDRYQYRTHEGEKIENNPTGFVVKINDEIETFLPFRLCSRFRELDQNYDGETVAVMVESFDPNSLSIILKEITITDQDIDIVQVNEALDLIGNAFENKKYIKGTIIAEKLKWSENTDDKKRAGYLITINGLEAFLPGSLSYFNIHTNIAHLIGTNIIAGVEEINVERMTIALNMKSPYQDILQGRKAPQINESTVGLVTQVTPYNVYVLLSNNILGMIPRYMYPQITHEELIQLTGTLIHCTPFRIKAWDKVTNNKSFLLSFNFKERV